MVGWITMNIFKYLYIYNVQKSYRPIAMKSETKLCWPNLPVGELLVLSALWVTLHHLTGCQSPNQHGTKVYLFILTKLLGVN